MMYTVEIGTEDGMDDLVALMAGQIQAEYKLCVMVETDNERLANAVGSLIGRIVLERAPLSPVLGSQNFEAIKGDECLPGENLKTTMLSGLPITRVHEYVYFDPYPAQQAAEIAEEIGELRDALFGGNGETAEPESVSAETVKIFHPRQGTETAKGKCKYCGGPVGPRAKACEEKDCKRKQNAEYQVRYQAKKARGGLPGASPAGASGTSAVSVALEKSEEVAASASPLAAPAAPVPDGTRIPGPAERQILRGARWVGGTAHAGGRGSRPWAGGDPIKDSLLKCTICGKSPAAFRCKCSWCHGPKWQWNGSGWAHHVGGPGCEKGLR